MHCRSLWKATFPKILADGIFGGRSFLSVPHRNQGGRFARCPFWHALPFRRGVAYEHLQRRQRHFDPDVFENWAVACFIAQTIHVALPKFSHFPSDVYHFSDLFFTFHIFHIFLEASTIFVCFFAFFPHCFILFHIFYIFHIFHIFSSSQQKTTIYNKQFKQPSHFGRALLLRLRKNSKNVQKNSKTPYMKLKIKIYQKKHSKNLRNRPKIQNHMEIQK